MLRWQPRRTFDQSIDRLDPQGIACMNQPIDPSLYPTNQALSWLDMLLAASKGGRLAAVAAAAATAAAAGGGGVVLALSVGPAQPAADTALQCRGGDDGVRELGVQTLLLVCVCCRLDLENATGLDTFGLDVSPHTQALSERLRKLGLEARDALGVDAATRFSRTLYHGLLTSVDYKVQCNRDRNLGRK